MTGGASVVELGTDVEHRALVPGFGGLDRALAGSDQSP
jgi:hypothetical protein